MKKAKLKATLAQRSKQADEYFDALRIIWDLGDPAVRAMIESALPGFKSRMQMYTVDGLLKELYAPQMKQQLEATNIWLSLSTNNSPKNTKSDGGPQEVWSVKTKVPSG